jgi:hypothetical protein
LLIEPFKSALLALQIVNPTSDKLKTGSREAMHLQSMLRMVRDKYRAATYMVCEGYGDKISVMALCAMARAGAMFVSLNGSELRDEDLELLRFNLRRFGARWNIGRKRT